MITDPYIRLFNLVRVIDGDTVVLDINMGWDLTARDAVRLIGINAPEISGPKATPAGQVAKQFVIDWFAAKPGPYSLISKKYERDKYGRALCVIYRDGDAVSLNDALIASGNAVPYMTA